MLGYFQKGGQQSSKNSVAFIIICTWELKLDNMVYNWNTACVHTLAKEKLSVIWSSCLTYKMRYHHPPDKDGFENSIKSNVNKALYIVSETDWKLKKKKTCYNSSRKWNNAILLPKKNDPMKKITINIT